MQPHQYSAQTLRVAGAQARIGLAIPPDPLAGLIQPLQVFRARCGRQRSYQSQNDANAYDYGWSAFNLAEDLPDGALNTPMSEGWFDAEKAWAGWKVL